jgi:hypothetical protein
MKSLAENPHRALQLIRTDPRDLLPAGHAIINANVQALLRGKYVRHDSRRRCGYALTTLGFHVTDVARDDQPQPPAADDKAGV